MFMCHAPSHRGIPRALLLSHFDGIEGATIFNDECLNYTSNFSGVSCLDTSVSKFGNSSLHLSNSEVFANTNIANAMCSGDFTIEFFVYHTDGDATVSRYVTYTYLTDVSIRRGGNIYHTYDYSADGQSIQHIFGSPVQMNTWIHIAKVRHNNIVSLYINGVSAGSYPHSEIVGFQNVVLGSAGTEWFAGNIDELRILPYAEYTSNFTPPTSKFSAFT